MGAPLNELSNAVLHARGNDEVIGLLLLQHHPLHAHIVFGVPPVAHGIEVAHVKAFFQPLGNVGQTASDLAGDEGFAPARTFVVEQDAVARVHPVSFAVVHHNPIRVHLGYCIGAPRIERCGFLLRDLLYQTEEFAGAGLIETGLLFQAEDANCLKKSQCAGSDNVGRVFWRLKTDGHVALGTQVVNFVWLCFLDDAHQVAGVAQVAVVQLEAGIVHMRVLVNVINTLSIE